MGKRASWSRLVVGPVGAALIGSCVSPVRLLAGPSRAVATSTVVAGARPEGGKQEARAARSEAAGRPRPASDALALVRMLPVGGDRCSVAQPARVPSEERALIALVSQSESWPWAFPLEVRAYARAERSPSLGERAVVEYVRFATDVPGVIEAALARMLARPLRFTDTTAAAPGDGCDGELTCSPLSARFVDAHTVRLAHGDWGEPGGAPSACIDALREAPSALEVSARSAWISGTELRGSRARLELSGDGVLRTSIRRYAEAAAAERALRAAQLGQDELATLAGVPASSLGERQGDRLLQTTFASFADLRLAAADQARAAAQVERAREPLAVDRVDPRDAASVRAAVDAQLATPRASGPPSAAQLAQLALLLERASAFHPDDAGLARRHYQLVLGLCRDPRAAFAIATRAQARKLDDAAGWQLRARAALSLFDETRLRASLSAAHGLSAGLATRMAHELVQKARAGEDYERAEWAFLAAQRLSRPGPGVPFKRRVATALHWPLSELPRLIAYLGQSAKPQLDLGVHVLAQAAYPRAAEVSELAATEALWQVDTLGGGRPGVMFAANSWDDAQLRALGRALSLRSDDGELELVIGLLAIGARARSTLTIVGRRQGAELVVEQLAEPLAQLRWPHIERLLAAPLRGLVGATYPPDELAIAASDAHEASQIVSAAESVRSVKCAIDGSLVRCRGSLADQAAARRALLAVASVLLRDEARALWSGTD